MWQAIAQQLSDTLQFDFNISEKIKLDGGEISECYMVTDGVQRYFVKCNSRDYANHFESEVGNLRSLKSTNTISVPEVILTGHSKNDAFIILNHLIIKPLNEKKSSFQFGQDLANLHKWGEQKEYGFDSDNFISSTLQPNAWHKKWHKFFAEQRIGWQLQLLAEKGVSFGDIKHIVGQVNNSLANHIPKPSLLHGNLRPENVANTAFGPLSFDPACYWGDRECDVALTELFGQFNNEFYAGYKSIYPLDKGYDDRKKIYNLYHILNHCNLFGGHHLEKAEHTISSL